MPRIGSLLHLGNELVEELRVATKPVASQKKRSCTNMLHAFVGSLISQRTHAARALDDPQLKHPRLGQHANLCILTGALELIHQSQPSSRGQGVHAVLPMTGVQKMIQDFPIQTMLLRQSVHGQRNCLCVSAHQMRGRQAMCFVLNVACKIFG